ncbi:MAG: BamA/TamA family outer membrane protein [Candidatus Cloacimonetes bacterium]|nr:BamA/TamA family outer membrane protein [Candidatus Cloacimonadota bacterium]
MKVFLIIIILLIAGSLIAIEIVELEFSGNLMLSDTDIQAVMISYTGMEYDQQIMLEDMQRIAELYSKKGYYLAKVMLPEVIVLSKSTLKVLVQIDEGSEILVSEILFTGNNYLTTDKLSRELKSPLVFLRDLPQYITELTGYYNQQGFYFAQIEIENIALEEEQAVVMLRIREGDYCRFTRNIVRGNKVTKKKTILQLSRLGEIETPTPFQLQQAASNLLARPYIKSCQIVPVDASTLLYEISEGNMTAFSGLVGYDNSVDAQGRFTGYIDVNFQNLGGTDRSAGFFWENRQRQHTAIELNYHESGWDYPVGADIQLYREEMDSTWIEVSYDLEVYWYDLFNQTGIYLEREDIYPGSRRPVLIDETQFNKAGVFWRFSSLDHPRNPQTGYAWSLKYYYIWSRAGEAKSGRQAAETHYQKLIPLTGRWVVSAGLNYNLIENKGITEFDKFEAGGSNSIRGFLEKQYAGFRVGWLNLEFRYILSEEARLSLNADVGNIESLQNGNETIYSIGCGLRTVTPVGQLVLDFAVPNAEQGFKNPLEGIVHFGLETRF